MTLNEAIKILSDAGVESPEFDAREIFMHFTSLKGYELVSRSSSSDDERLAAAIAERAARKPLQYILGYVGFYRECYKVTPDCLIPREDTEILVDFAVKNIPEGESFIDICTGSGCVAISTLKNTKNTTALAIDLSLPALTLARENAENNGVSERLELLEKDALTFIPDKEVFAILSNPPYVTVSEYASLQSELYHEPEIAFVGGEDGLDFYKKIVPLTKEKIKKHGFLAFEIGKDQANALLNIAAENSMSAEILNDLSGNPRVAVLRSLK